MNTENKITVTFTDTFGGEPNFCWIKKYEFDNSIGFKKALTLAKKEYFRRGMLPRHRLVYDAGDEMLVKFDGCCICAFVQCFY